MAGVPWATSLNNDVPVAGAGGKKIFNRHASSMKTLLYSSDASAQPEDMAQPRQGKRSYGIGAAREAPFALDTIEPGFPQTNAAVAARRKEGAAKINGLGFDPAVYMANGQAAKELSSAGRNKNLIGGGKILSFDEE